VCSTGALGVPGCKLDGTRDASPRRACRIPCLISGLVLDSTCAIMRRVAEHGGSRCRFSEAPRTNRWRRKAGAPELWRSAASRSGGHGHLGGVHGRRSQSRVHPAGGAQPPRAAPGYRPAQRTEQSGRLLGRLVLSLTEAEVLLAVMEGDSSVQRAAYVWRMNAGPASGRCRRRLPRVVARWDRAPPRCEWAARGGRHTTARSA